jgi:hypothetical protein
MSLQTSTIKRKVIIFLIHNKEFLPDRKTLRCEFFVVVLIEADFKSEVTNFKRAA